MVRPTIWEEFQLSLRELVLTAGKLKDMRLPETPIMVPLRVAIDLVEAISPLEPLLGKAVDQILRDSDQLELDAAVLSQSLEDTRGIPASHRCHTVTGE